MKALGISHNCLCIVDMPDPTISSEDVLVEVKACGICGSDWHRVRQVQKDYSVIWGHEITGIVVDTGSSVKNIRNGMRVVINPLQHCGLCSFCQVGNYNHCVKIKRIGSHINGGFSDRVVVNQNNVLILPSNVDYYTGTLVDCFAVAFHAINMVLGLATKRICIFGSGTIAIIVAMILKDKGCSDITIVCRNIMSEKVQRIKRELQVSILDEKQIQNLPSPPKFDVVFEVVGGNQSDTLSMAIEVTKQKGQIVVLGVYDQEFFFTGNFRRLFYKEIHMIGSNSFSASFGRDEFEQALDYIAFNRDRVSWLISKYISLEDLPEYLACGKEDNNIKTVVVV